MSAPIRQIFYRTIFLLFIPLITDAQSHADDVRWYQHFFEHYDPASVEPDLKAHEEELQNAYDKLDFVSAIRLSKEAGLLHLTRTRNYDKALEYLMQSLTLEDSLNVHDKQVFTHLAIAEVFEAVGNPDKSAQELKEAARLNDKDQDVQMKVLIMNKLGMVNASRGDTDAALANYQLALTFRDQVPKNLLAETLFNLAHLTGMTNHSVEALQLHKEALALWRSLHDRINEAQSLNDIAKLYHQMKNDGRELDNHMAALKIRQALKDPKGLAESYYNIGSLYARQQDNGRAIANLELARDFANEAQDHQTMRLCYDLLASCYKSQGNYKNALQNREDYRAMTDLIQQEINEQQLLERQNQYVLGQREGQIEDLEKIRLQRERELQEQQRFQNYLLLIICLIAISVVLVLYFYSQKQKTNAQLQLANEKVNHQNLQLQELNATKDKFFSIISHDVKGPLNSLTSFSSMLVNHFDALTKEEIQMLAKDSDKSLKNLFAMLDNLLEWARSQTGTIEFKADPFDLNGLLAANKELLDGQAANKRITILHDPAEAILVKAHKNSINTVVRNLISNAIKFTPEGGAISLAIQQGDKEAIVSVSDTGVGIRKDIIDRMFRIDAKHSTKGTANEKGTGLGLILCKDFVEKNGGRLWVESEENKGSVFYFSVPR